MLADTEVPALTLDAVLLTLYCWLAVTIVGGLVVASIWRGRFALADAIFRPQRIRAVPWGFLGVIGSFCLYDFWVRLFADVVKEIWAIVLACPFYVASTVFFLRQTMGARLYQFGLTLHRWRQDVVAGYATFAIATPLTFSIFFIIQAALTVLHDDQNAVHSVEKLLREEPNFGNWLAVTLVTIIAAPVMEELLFRGLLQRWFVEMPFAADAAILLSLFCAVSLGLTRELRYEKFTTWWPLIFLVVVGAAYIGFERLTSPWLNRPGAGRAIFASSLLFAASHADVWPTPIPLFFLGLALGWLAYRTQSIIGCMICHGLFNSVTVIELVVQPVLKL